MNLSLRIARRYLFSKKSTNAINLISGISIFGLSIGTAALILVLSVFNGFEDLILGLFNTFNPDVKISPAKGKVFDADSVHIDQIMALEGVTHLSKSLEEIAFFEYNGSRDYGILKGVDEAYKIVTNIDSVVREGKYLLKDEDRSMAVMGYGMRNRLSANVQDPFSTINVYMPKRKKSPIGKPFKKRFLYPGGTFALQQDFDNEYIITNLAFAQEIIGVGNKLSYLELSLAPDIDNQETIDKIKDILGPGFIVKNRYQQDEAFLKLMNLEKWMSFVILSLTLLLVAFNMIGLLWMIVLEKKNDIAILKSMGAYDSTIRNIFLGEGFLLCLVGMGLGFFIAILLYISQKTFGIVPIPEGFVIDAYPISMRFFDFMIVAITVIAIGLLASIPAALRAMRVSTIIREG